MRSIKILKLFLLSGFLIVYLNASGQSNRENYIRDKLNKVDSLIAINDYVAASQIISTVKNTFTLRDTDTEKYAFDLRYARILYKNAEKGKSLEILLDRFNELKKKPELQSYIEYAKFLSRVFADAKNYDKALYFNRLAYKAARTKKDTLNMVQTLNRMGSFKYADEQIDSAKYFFRQVTLFPEKNIYINQIANAYNNLGVIYQYEDDLKKAKYYLNQAKEIKERINDNFGAAYLLVNLGNINHYDRKYKQAVDNYEQAYNYVENDSSITGLSLQRAIYDNISVTYDSLKQYKKALHYAVESGKLYEKITDLQQNERLAEVEAKFNLSQQEHQLEMERNKAWRVKMLFYGLIFVTITFVVLAMIFYKNYKLKQQNRFEQVQNETQNRIINATIDAKEKERKNIAEILHDSVSALLSSVNLHIQASKAKIKPVPAELNKAQKILGEASAKIRDLSHELISSVLIKFGLAFAVHDLCQKYSNSELELSSDDNGIKRYNQKFEIKIYNIIEELINNIIKHAKAKHATINLAERNGNQLIIQIIDDGVGFDVKRAKGKNGLGLSHIEARVKGMNGVFNINSKKGEGTSIYISVPIFTVTKPFKKTEERAVSA